MKRGILFDKIEESDVDRKGNPDPDLFAEVSPFHDDHNDEKVGGSEELLFECYPEGEEPEPTEDIQEVLQREGKKLKRKGGADPSRMMRRLSLVSGHQSGYKGSPQVDFVEERREKERQERMKTMHKANQEIEKKGFRWPDEWKDQPVRTIALNRDEAAKGIGKPVPFELKLIAQRIGADPTALMWPRYMRNLTNAQITQVVDAVKTKPQTAAIWNFVIKQLSPGEQYRKKQGKIELDYVLHEGQKVRVKKQGGFSIRRVPPSVPEWEGPYIENPVPLIPGITDHSCVKDPMEFGLIMSESWMEDVENGREVKIRNRKTGEMERLQTHCVVSGNSLVSKKERGYKHWVLAPDLWGMGIKQARVVVSAAAVEAGLTEGKVNYPEGELGERLRTAVSDLRNNPDAWAVVAVASNNRHWREIAMVMLSLRDAAYFGMEFDDVLKNQRELRKLSRRGAMFVN